MQVNRLAYLAPLLLIALSCSGCPSRQEIEAALWLNNGLPADLCEIDKPMEERSELAQRLWRRGMYRELNTGKKEFLSYCHPTMLEMFGAYKVDTNRIIDAYLPKPATP